MPSTSAHFSTPPIIPLSKVSSVKESSVVTVPSFKEAGVIPNSASLFSPTLLTTSVAIQSAVSSESIAPLKNSSSPTGMLFASSSSNEPNSSASIPSSVVVSVVAGASVTAGASVVVVDSVPLPEHAAATIQIDVNKQNNNRFIIFLIL